VKTSTGAARAWGLWLYVGCVIALGAFLLVRFTPLYYPSPILALALLASSALLSIFKLRLPLGRNVSTMSMACAADLVALCTMGPHVAMVTASTGVLLQCTVRVRRSQPLYRAAFSVASVAVTAQAAGYVWGAFGGVLAPPGVMTLIVPLICTTATYYLVNTGLVATAVGLSNGESPARAWHREFFWSAPSYLLSGIAAGVVGLIIAYDGYILLPLAFIPLYVSYRAYQQSLRRIDDERRHTAALAEALERATRSEFNLAAEKERLVLESSRLAVTVQTIRDGVITVDRQGKVVLMNDEARRLAALMPEVPDDSPIVPLLCTLGLTTDAAEEALRRVWAGESVRLQNDVPADDALPLLEVTGAPTRDVEGQVAGAVWVMHDISHIARAEQERAKAAHLESIGVLAGGLAHDFNNIMMGIVGNLSLAEDLVRPDQEGLAARLSHAAAAASRARGVTSQLLTFAKGGAPIKTTASVRELVVECTRFALSGSRVAPRFEVAEDVWPADVDLDQIGQVVHNLVLNAVQAMPDGGLLQVWLANVDVHDEASSPAVGFKPGRYIRLTVQDQGYGIAPEDIGRIFDPYFTTKEMGSGLGLAITYSIVHAHGGLITVESRQGEGTRFTVYLPASTRMVAPRTEYLKPPVSRLGGRVLLMDDDEMVAEVAAEMLQALGFTTEASASGEAAIERFRNAEARREPFDIVILDLTVAGGMGGAEAVLHIRKIRPSITVYVMSGYTDDSVLSRFRDYGFDGVLPKPFGVADLRRVLQAEQPAAR
jgi:signal transduction histidine kinase/ActR/RegA family two-component response regulator